MGPNCPHSPIGSIWGWTARITITREHYFPMVSTPCLVLSCPVLLVFHVHVCARLHCLHCNTRGGHSVFPEDARAQPEMSPTLSPTPKREIFRPFWVRFDPPQFPGCMSILAIWATRLDRKNVAHFGLENGHFFAPENIPSYCPNGAG